MWRSITHACFTSGSLCSKLDVEKGSSVTGVRLFPWVAGNRLSAACSGSVL